jgi:hypothetical protein
VATSRAQPSPPFASRELNGEVLLEALDELRAASVHQKHLVDCASAVRDLTGLRVADATTRLKQLAGNRFSGQPALASQLVRWAQKLKSEADVALLVDHLERLALTAAIVSGLRRASDRLPRGGRTSP